jgi:hypothetical protein
MRVGSRTRSNLRFRPVACGKGPPWYLAQTRLGGCNFLPSTAVNEVEMWQAATFDP